MAFTSTPVGNTQLPPGFAPNSDSFGQPRLSGLDRLQTQVDATLREAPTGAIPPRLFTIRHSPILGRDVQSIGSHQPPLVTHTFRATPSGMQSSYAGKPPASLPPQEIVDFTADNSYGTYIPGSGATGMGGDRPPRVSATASHNARALTGAGPAEAAAIAYATGSESESRGAGSTTRGRHTSSDAASSTSNSAPVAEKGCFRALIDCIAEVATKIWNAVKDFFMFLFCCNTTPATEEEIATEREKFDEATQKIQIAMDKIPNMASFRKLEKFECVATQLEALATQTQNLKRKLENDTILPIGERSLRIEDTLDLIMKLSEKKDNYIEKQLAYFKKESEYLEEHYQVCTLRPDKANTAPGITKYFSSIISDLKENVQAAECFLARIELTNTKASTESQVATNQIIDSIQQTIEKFKELISKFEQYHNKALAAEQAANEACDVDGDYM